MKYGMSWSLQSLMLLDLVFSFGGLVDEGQAV